MIQQQKQLKILSLDKYIGSFPKLSKTNSFIVDDMIIYHKSDNKGIRTYYDYTTGYKLGISVEKISDNIKVGLNHEEFVEYLKANLRTEIGKINT